MKRGLAFLRILATIVTVYTTDYCTLDTCYYGKHIACGNNRNFAKSCAEDASMVKMTNELQNFIVKYHNEKRDFIAGGGDVKLRPACRMATIAWDDELAELAALNVKQCKLQHDRCHNTEAFEYSGQNLAWTQFVDEPNHKVLWQRLLDLWYNEVEFCKQNVIDAYRDDRKSTYGHFTVMVADRNTRVGCAASQYGFFNERMKSYLIACNYATTNVLNFPIYLACDKAGTSCKTGTNPQYVNLCSVSEQYEVNKWF